MNKMTQALEDHSGRDANSVEGDIQIEDEEVELDLERAQTVEDPIQDFFSRSEVEAVKTAETENSKSHRNALVSAGLVKDH